MLVGSQGFISLPSYIFVSRRVSELCELNQSDKEKDKKNFEINLSNTQTAVYL